MISMHQWPLPTQPHLLLWRHQAPPTRVGFLSSGDTQTSWYSTLKKGWKTFEFKETKSLKQGQLSFIILLVTIYISFLFIPVSWATVTLFFPLCCRQIFNLSRRNYKLVSSGCTWQYLLICPEKDLQNINQRRIEVILKYWWEAVWGESNQKSKILGKDW